MIYDYTEWGPRFVPGTVAEGGREFIYVEITQKEVHTDFFLQLALACKGIPKDGGMLEEKARIRMPSGKLMQGISYKGDLEGWHFCITAFCEKNGIIRGKIEGDRIVLSSGDSAALSECKVEMW